MGHSTIGCTSYRVVYSGIDFYREYLNEELESI